MAQLLENVLMASFHGSVVILAVLLLRLVLKKAPKKYICYLWMLAGLRLLLPIEIRSDFSLQPRNLPVREAAQMAVNWSAVLPWLWVAIALGFAVYSLVSYLRLKRRVRDAVRIRGGWESDRIETAFILGFIKPRIYIPTGMGRQDRKYILEHERTHLDKGDHWMKMIGFVALALHWFNPLVWVAYLCLCKDIEMACDERVVQFMELEERKGYSAALLSCSTNHPHFASPVAFGEISVKERIMSILHYKKPAFWISLLAVLAIGFVALCLLTSPSQPEASEPTVPTTPEGETGYAAGLKESEIAYVCEKAMEELLARESYFIRNEQTVTYVSDGGGMEHYTTENRRFGDNVLNAILQFEGEENVGIGGNMIYEGQYALFMGDSWMWQGETSTTGQEWLEAYSPKGNVVTFPEGTGIISGDTVAFQMEWTSKTPWTQNYTGILEFTFREDGTLSTIHREYTDVNEDGYETRYDHRLTILEEAPGDTAAYIDELAATVLTEEEVTAARKEAQTITEIPSNKTSYDLDFGLGAGSSQWQFLDESWHVRIGAEEATPTGVTMVYSESGDSHSSFTADATYWLEKLEGDTWVMVGDYATGEVQTIDVSWTTGHAYTIDWTEAYGALGEGYYRIGRYYTVTLTSGETETAPCYAKFRLYDPNQDALLAKSRGALDALLAADSFHIFTTEYNVELQRHEEEPRYSTEEIWKHGADYLQEWKTHYVDQSKGLWGHSGALWRDGKTYNITWEGEDMTTPVAEWNVNTYMDETNIRLWEMTYTWYDSRVEGVAENGNEIVILEVYDFNNDYEQIETRLTFNGQGGLTGIRRALLPTRYCAEDDKIVDAILVVFDTTADETAGVIAGQDLTKVKSFSWEEEKDLYKPGEDDLRTKNFHNTSAVTIAGPEAAIDRALKDCTLPAAVGLEPGTNMMEAFYDESTQMWKVEFTASWDDSIYQAVYMDSQGITQMTIILELEVEY